MTGLRALIVDDEPLARRGIRQLLGKHPDVSVVAECRNGREALRAGSSAQLDLIFLDVQMPGSDGFDVLRRWPRPVLPVIVFVTAYEEFALQAFENCALDYLVKPVSEHRFESAMRRVRQRIEQGGAAEALKRLTQLLDERDGRPSRPPLGIVVSTGSGNLVLDPSEVDWIEARDYCACLHVGNRRYLLRESLRSLDRRLDSHCFVRVHRGAIVRLDRVREVRTVGERTMVLLKTGDAIPVSRRQRDKLKARLRTR